MVMGDVCTRNCKFCGVGKGAPVQLDPVEPENVAKAIDKLGLAHAVVTSVTRDDLPDGGAAHFAATVAAIRGVRPVVKVEALVPDFLGNPDSIMVMLDSAPDIFAHNIEMAERLYPALRSARHSYQRSLDVLKIAAERSVRNNGSPIVKSGLMVGLGETDEEIKSTLRDLSDVGCRAVSIGQYLRPSPAQCEVARYVEPERFAEYEQMAREMGFVHAMAGPFVRSSYHSDEVWKALERSPASVSRE
jgi:lipoic acid synthetase